MGWKWLFDCLKFGLYNGSPTPLFGDFKAGVPINAAYPPLTIASDYDCLAIRCNNLFGDTDPDHTVGYKWTNVQAEVWGGPQNEWTIALTLNSMSPILGSQYVLGAQPLFGAPIHYLSITGHPSFQDLHWWTGTWLTGDYAQFGQSSATEFPVVLTMSVANNRRRMYAHGVEIASDSFNVIAWAGAYYFTLGSLLYANPAESNDGHYATTLVCDKEWSPAEVAQWSADPTAWAQAACIHANASLKSSVGAAARLAAPTRSNLKLQSPVSAACRLAAPIRANCSLRAPVGANLKLCQKGTE